MGYKEWRARQNARIDGMVARSEERSRAAQAKLDDLQAEQEQARAVRADTEADAWMRTRAGQLGEDHDDLVARAEAVGIPLPTPRRRKGGGALGVLGAVGELVMLDGAGEGGHRIDRYEHWRDRVVVAEARRGRLGK